MSTKKYLVREKDIRCQDNLVLENNLVSHLRTTIPMGGYNMELPLFLITSSHLIDQ
jgi:hypothetical protein